MNYVGNHNLLFDNVCVALDYEYDLLESICDKMVDLLFRGLVCFDQRRLN